MSDLTGVGIDVVGDSLFRWLGDRTGRRLSPFIEKMDMDLMGCRSIAKWNFITVMWLRFMGGREGIRRRLHDHAIVPPKARVLLARFNDRSQHYEVRKSRESKL